MTSSRRLGVRVSSLFFALGLSGCQSLHRSPQVHAPTNGSAEYGYALLFDLMGDEQNVSKLRFIKHERPEPKELVKEISSTCGQAHKQLAAFGKADAALNLKNPGLPAAELEARAAIGKTKGKALLTDKNKEFEIQLLLSQAEALAYGAHLASTTAQREPNPQRAQFLGRLSNDLTRLYEKVVGMLVANYSWPGSK